MPRSGSSGWTCGYHVIALGLLWFSGSWNTIAFYGALQIFSCFDFFLKSVGIIVQRGRSRGVLAHELPGSTKVVFFGSYFLSLPLKDSFKYVVLFLTHVLSLLSKLYYKQSTRQYRLLR